MKKITKKIISMLVSTVMAVTSLSMSFASTFAEDMNDVNSTGTNAALDVKSGGLLGELIPDQINEVSNENQEKRQKEYAIYKMEYDVSMTNLIVSYSAKTNCTIFVGFYNDEGTQLFTSVTEALPAGTDVTAVIEKPDDLPEYYLIKAFMIGQANEPLTESFAEKKFTKAVQEIINKDASEFDQDKVIKFDDYNFIVSKNEYEKIESNENSDTLVEQFDDDTYLFTNINKIKDLKKGQIVLFDFSNKMLLFEISDISITDSTALIKKKESDTDELISFMKFDSSKADKKADISYTPNGEDDVEFEIVENNSKSHSDVNGDRKPFPSLFSVFDKVTFNPCIKFPLKKVSSSDESDIDLGIEGYIEIGAEIELEAYYEDKTEYVKGSFTLYTDFASEGEAELSVNLGYAYFTFFKLFDITFSPKLNVKLGGNFKFRLSRTWDFGDAATAEERIPHNEKGFEGSFEIDVYIITEIKASLLFSDLFSLSIEPEIGIKHEFTSTDARNNEYVHHDCESCDSITQSFYVECSFKLKFLGVNILDGEKRKFTVTAERELRQWHNNDGTWKEGPCENMSHKVTFYVQEPIVENSDKGKVTVKYVPSIGAKLYLETPNDGEKPCIDTDGTHIKTDNEGKASLWVKATTLTDEDSFIVAKNTENNIGSASLGGNWVPKVKKSCIISVFITNEKDTKGRSFNEINCGTKIKDSTGNDTGEVYDVNFSYNEVGDCIIRGEGGCDVQKLLKILKDNNFNYINRLIIDGVGKGIALVGTFGTFPIKTAELRNTSLSQSCFRDNPILQRVYICNLGWITSFAFQNCCNLETVDLSNDIDLKEIYYNAFENCSKLKNIDLFYNTGLEEIGSEAFKGTKIEELVCPPNLKKIGYAAFDKCYNLQKLVFNDIIENVDGYSFYGTGIKELMLPVSIKQLGLGAFSNCKSLETITMNCTTAEISECIFSGCSNLKNVTIADGFTKISDKEFSGCGIENIELPDSITSIDQDAFESTKLITINLPDSITTIGRGAFRESDIRYLSLPSELETIGEYAFCQCKSLAYLECDDKIKTIGQCAFQDTPALNSIDLPDSVTEIGFSAFLHSGLTSIKIPSGLKTIETNAFTDTNIKSVIIPENIEKIEANAFHNNTLLKNMIFLTFKIELVDDKYGTSTPHYTCDPNKVPDSDKIFIYGYEDSDVHNYCRGHSHSNLVFKSLGSYSQTTPSTTTTTTTMTNTTTTITTTTTAVVSTNVSPLAKCVLIAVGDAANINSSSEKFLVKENVKFFDQKDADKEGNVSFGYIPNNDEHWIFVFIAEAIDGMAKRTVWGVKGDANSDGSVDMSDVVLIMQALASPNKYGLNGSNNNHINENGLKCSDVDSTPGLTVNDALHIQKYLLRIIPTL